MARNLGSILDECLRELAAGESVESCLSRYPEQAAQLAPMLAAARELTALQSIHLAEPARLRAKTALRNALADQRSVSRERVRMFPSAPRLAWAMAGVIAVALLLAIGGHSVSASQPGDLAYRIRVVVEQWPVAFQTNMEARFVLQMRVAERRLDDLSSHGYEPVALRAMLSADESAAVMARELGDWERAQVAEQLAAQVRTLTQLAQATSDLQAENALRIAAEQAFRISRSMGGGPAEPRRTPTSPGLGGVDWTPQPSMPPATAAFRPQRSTQPTGAPATTTPRPKHTSQPSRAPATATRERQQTPSFTETRAPVPTVGLGTPLPGGTGGPQNTPEPGPQNTPDPGPQNTPEPGPRNTPEPGPQNTPDPGPQNTSAPGPQNTPEPGPQNTPDPGPQDTPGPNEPPPGGNG